MAAHANPAMARAVDDLEHQIELPTASRELGGDRRVVAGMDPLQHRRQPEAGPPVDLGEADRSHALDRQLLGHGIPGPERDRGVAHRRAQLGVASEQLLRGQLERSFEQQPIGVGLFVGSTDVGQERAQRGRVRIGGTEVTRELTGEQAMARRHQISRRVVAVMVWLWSAQLTTPAGPSSPLA